MKKISILMFSCLALLLVTSACSSDNQSPTPTASILGKWDFNKSSYIANGVTIPEQDFEGNEPGCNKDFWKFKNDGLFTSGHYSSDCILSAGDVSWTQTNNTISIDPIEAEEGGIPALWEIVSVSATDLQIKGDMTGMEGVEPGVVIFMILKFKKSANQG